MIADEVYQFPRLVNPILPIRGLKPAFFKISNCDFRSVTYPKGKTVTDPPFGIDFKGTKTSTKYQDYQQKEYLKLLGAIPQPCVALNYPEQTGNVFTRVEGWGPWMDTFTWIYNSQMPHKSRVASYWGCRYDYRMVPKDYCHPNDKRIRERMELGLPCSGNNWLFLPTVTNNSKEKVRHPESGLTHPCVTPEIVFKFLILSVYEPGVLFIDPFMGSGTSAVVCRELNIPYWGFEINKANFEIARHRLGI